MYNGSIVSVVIAAAGRGERFGAELPKQFCQLGDVPVIFRTVSAFSAHPFVDKIVVAVRSDYMDLCSNIINGVGDSISVVSGGKSRQESVFNAFKSLSNDGGTQFVMVHDGARPLVSEKLISTSIEMAALIGASVPVIELDDTIGAVSDGKVVSYVDRSVLRRIQTPQVFRYDILENAFARSVQKDTNFTDESAMVVDAGFEVSIVEGSRKNIKITNPVDLLVAESMLGEICTE